MNLLAVEESFCNLLNPLRHAPCLFHTPGCSESWFSLYPGSNIMVSGLQNYLYLQKGRTGKSNFCCNVRYMWPKHCQNGEASEQVLYFDNLGEKRMILYNFTWQSGKRWCGVCKNDLGSKHQPHRMSLTGLSQATFLVDYSITFKWYYIFYSNKTLLQLMPEWQAIGRFLLKSYFDHRVEHVSNIRGQFLIRW